MRDVELVRDELDSASQESAYRRAADLGEVAEAFGAKLVHPRLVDLASREAQCCAFLTLGVDRIGDAVVLTITGAADAQPVIGLIVGE